MRIKHMQIPSDTDHVPVEDVVLAEAEEDAEETDDEDVEIEDGGQSEEGAPPKWLEHGEYRYRLSDEHAPHHSKMAAKIVRILLVNAFKSIKPHLVGQHKFTTSSDVIVDAYVPPPYGWAKAPARPTRCIKAVIAYANVFIPAEAFGDSDHVQLLGQALSSIRTKGGAFIKKNDLFDAEKSPATSGHAAAHVHNSKGDNVIMFRTTDRYPIGHMRFEVGLVPEADEDDDEKIAGYELYGQVAVCISGAAPGSTGVGNLQTAYDTALAKAFRTTFNKKAMRTAVTDVPVIHETGGAPEEVVPVEDDELDQAASVEDIVHAYGGSILPLHQHEANGLEAKFPTDESAGLAADSLFHQGYDVMMSGAMLRILSAPRTARLSANVDGAPGSVWDFRGKIAAVARSTGLMGLASILADMQEEGPLVKPVLDVWDDIQLGEEARISKADSGAPVPFWDYNADNIKRALGQLLESAYAPEHYPEGEAPRRPTNPDGLVTRMMPRLINHQ